MKGMTGPLHASTLGKTSWISKFQKKVRLTSIPLVNVLTLLKCLGLNFALRMCKEYESDKSQQLIDNCHYLPLSLEMESPEFVESLGFLNQPFSFPKTQLSLFVRTLYDNLLSSQDDQDED